MNAGARPVAYPGHDCKEYYIIDDIKGCYKLLAPTVLSAVHTPHLIPDLNTQLPSEHVHGDDQSPYQTQPPMSAFPRVFPMQEKSHFFLPLEKSA